MAGRGMKEAQKEIVTLVNKLENRNTKTEVITNKNNSSFLDNPEYFDDDNTQFPGSEN